MPDYHVKRCFIALPVDEAMMWDLRDVVRDIEIDGMRATEPEKLHVTLKFLGDVEDPEIPDVLEAMRLAGEGVEAFELRWTGVRYFPHARRIRVLAAMLDEPEAVMRLHQRLDDACDAIGFRREVRAYHPHITLGRFKRAPKQAPDVRLIQTPDAVMAVDRMVLCQSILHHHSVEYVKLAEVKLGE